MLKKYSAIFGLLLLAMAAIVVRVIDIAPYPPPAYAQEAPPRARISRTMRVSAGADYVPLFIINQYNIGNVSSFALDFWRTDITSAEIFAEAFDMSDEDFFETDDYFFFWNDYSVLRIYRDAPQLTYEVFGGDIYFGGYELTDEDRVNIAVNFMAARGLNYDFEEARVHTNGFLYMITFIRYLENRPLFAFNSRVIMDFAGNVLSLDYHFPAFERINRGRVITQLDALHELPARDDGRTVYLDDGQLVFIFSESILQPAYFFEGETLDGEVFGYFVKAKTR